MDNALSDHSTTPPPAAPVPDGDPVTIVEDLYCLDCGYNLRGLAGDPARCPECGYSNDLGTARLPADLIRKALRDMETTPTVCVALAILVCVFVSWNSVRGFGDSWSTWILALFCAAGWYGLSRRMADRFDRKSGWKRILFDFHLATLLCTLVVQIGVIAYWIRVRHSVRVMIVSVLWGIAFFVGLRIYFAARDRIKEMQRDAAVRIAKETLERLLRKQPK